jgi:hypothetical protein
LDGTLEADWERLQLSMGRLAVPDFGETVVEADRLSVPVAGKMVGGRRVCLYAYCPAAAQGVMAVAAGSTTMTLQLPTAWQGCEVHVFGFAFDANGNASPTVYLTRIQANEKVSDSLLGIPCESGVAKGKKHTPQSARLTHSSVSPCSARNATGISLPNLGEQLNRFVDFLKKEAHFLCVSV